MKEKDLTKEEWIDIAFENSYKVIILDYDSEELMDEGTPVFVHNPARRLPKMEDLESMIDYYKLKEDYIRCQALHNYIKEILE